MFDDDLWLRGITRGRSNGSLPTYSAAAANEILGRQAGLREQIRGGTFVRPTVVEMVDLGPEDDQQPPPPGETDVILPPPPPRC